MRFLIKWLMSIHCKLWRWGESWGEIEYMTRGAHFSNAFLAFMEGKNSGQIITFFLATFLARQMTKQPGDSWVPRLWIFAVFIYFFVMILDTLFFLLAIADVIFFNYILGILVVLPMRALGLWKDGIINIDYLKEIWLEIQAEHELMVMNNVVASM